MSGTAASASAQIGNLLGIAAGTLWGATTLVVRTTRLARAPAAVTLWHQLLGGCLIGITAALWLGDMEATASTTLVASLAYQTVILSTVSYLAWFALLRRYLASRLGVLTLMTPVFGMAFGVAVLGDELTPQFLSGTALILSGILLVSGREFVRRHPRNLSSRETSAENAH